MKTTSSEKTSTWAQECLKDDNLSVNAFYFSGVAIGGKACRCLGAQSRSPGLVKPIGVSPLRAARLLTGT